MELIWAVLGLSWSPVSCEAVLGALAGRLGALLGRLGSLRRPSWASSGLSWGHPGPSGGFLGSLEAVSEACLGDMPSWAILGPSWMLLGPS